MCFFFKANSQNGNYFRRPNLGLSISLYEIEGYEIGKVSFASPVDTLMVFGGSYGMPGISVGFNLPLVKINDNNAFGVQPTLLAGGDGGNFFMTFPLLLSFKIGGDATMNSDKFWGGGIGCGFQPTFILSGDAGNALYGLPVLFGELIFGKNNPVKIRFVKQLRYYERTVEYQAEDTWAGWSKFSPVFDLSILWVFMIG